MLTSERIEEIQSRSRADYACLDAPGFRDSLAARRDVAALLTDRTELQAEIERLREQTQKWVKDWEVECQRYEAALGIATSEHVALKAENERLRAVVEAAREGCDTCHKYNGDDYCCDCYHAGSGTWDALCALEARDADE